MAALATPLIAAASGFVDTFDSENGGASALNYASFANWTVNPGTVDLVHSGDYGVNCFGGAGSCVDLDGSTNASGTLNSASYGFSVGQTVTLSWELSGNQRGAGPDQFFAGFTFGGTTPIADYTLGGAFGNADLGSFTTDGITTSSSIADNAPFALYSISFKTLSSGTLIASIGQSQGLLGSNDSVGPTLDDVTLSIDGAAVPEPAAWTTILLGLGVAGIALRGRRRGTVSA